MAFAYWCAMDNTQGGKSSASDVRVICAETDVHLGQEYGA